MLLRQTYTRVDRKCCRITTSKTNFVSSRIKNSIITDLWVEKQLIIVSTTDADVKHYLSNIQL